MNHALLAMMKTINTNNTGEARFFSNGQYVKLAMHLRRTLNGMMTASEARAAVIRTCRNIRFDRAWQEMKRDGRAA